jgi:recombination-associated protein rdgC
MLWFKNLAIYKLTKDIDLSDTTLKSALEDLEFTPCGPQDISKFGFVQPMSESTELFYKANNQILILTLKEEKNIPKNEIKDELDRRVSTIELTQSRKLNKAEIASIKDDVILSLLPRAFSKKTHTPVWIDLNKNLIIVDSSSFKKAEDCLALLRKALGSLPVVPYVFSKNVSAILNHWVTENITLENFDFSGNFELKDANKTSVVGKNEDISLAEFTSFINMGKSVTKIGLIYDDALEFALCEDNSIKGIKYLESIKLQKSELDKDNPVAAFDAEFFLMTETLSNLFSQLEIALKNVNSGESNQSPDSTLV